MLALAKRHKLYHKTKIAKFLIPRDSHKSVFDAVKLADCEAILLPCEVNNDFQISTGAQLEAIRLVFEKYKSEDICAIVLTRPNYHGLMVSSEQFRAMVELCHTNGVLVLVDEAHGSHLRFLDSPYSQGAICVM
jgi:arginine/lysine/ornithine decarboxylase